MRSASRPSVWFWIFAAVVAATAAVVAPVLYRTAVLCPASSPNGYAGMYLSLNVTPPPYFPRI